MKIGCLPGCFDSFSELHKGHRYILAQTAKYCDRLTVLLNSDFYIRNFKHREPLLKEEKRKQLLMENSNVWDVIIFDGPSPLKYILELRPDFLFAGSDYTLENIVGAKEVLSWGGVVKVVDRLPGYSTTELIRQTLDYSI